MKAKITVDMDNAAFEDPGYELARILRYIADRVEDGVRDIASIADLNGNHVAELKITGKRPK